MDIYKETASTWNKIAKFYEEKFMDLDIYNETYDYFCGQLLKQEAEVLELGCGPGNITNYLLKKLPAIKLLGTDVAPAMLDLAQKNNPSAAFQVLDCRDVLKLNRRFDGVIAGFCIPYISSEDYSKLLRDIEETLFPNGLLYLSFVNGKSEDSRLQTNSYGDKMFFYYHEEETIFQLLSENSFRILKTFYVKYDKGNGNLEVHTIVIAQKFVG